MSHIVLGIGAAATTASGAVWYLPAISQLRAGADRPVATRLAASACLAGWGTLAVLALLLITPASWQVLFAVACAGAAAVVVLQAQAHTSRRHQQREEQQQWAVLRSRQPAVQEPIRAQQTFAAWTLSGLAVASASGAAVMLTGDTADGVHTAMAVFTTVTVSILFLFVAIARANAIRRRDHGMRVHLSR